MRGRKKKFFVNFLKTHKGIYNLYYVALSAILKMFHSFMRTDDKLVLFNSFGGKKYDDSPKSIYEAMLKDDRFKDYKFVWAFHDTDKFEVSGARIIKTDTFKYFKTAMKARVWITNSSIERGLEFKGKNTIYFNTWHGTPIKKMGTDISQDSKSFATKSRTSIDVMTAQSDFEADIFSRVFNINSDKFLRCGLPRNDKYANITSEQVEKIKQKLNIPIEKKCILYAPTFREYDRDKENSCVLAPPMDIEKWQEILGNEYVLLFRAHYEIGKIMHMEDNDFVRNVSGYPLLEDLMIISDVLISDYSSIFFDFSIMDKAMLHFTYDYEEYATKRGMYFDIRKWISGADNADELLEIIKNFDFNTEVLKTKQFREKYVNYYGNATKQCLDCIYKNLGGVL